MKKLAVLVLTFVITCSCITVRNAPVIEDYAVKDGKEFQKRNFSDKTVFVFENDLKMIDFRSFLAEKFEITSFKDTKRITVIIDDIPFDLYVFTPTKSSKRINFVDAIISKNANDISVDETKYDYVGISVSTIGDEDCLSESSIYQNLVLNYLIDLKDEYFEL
jgi:hypothetical protein